jgi:hypothetical protein
MRSEHLQHALRLAERQIKNLSEQERHEKRSLVRRRSSIARSTLPESELVSVPANRLERQAERVLGHVVVAVEVDRNELEIERERVETNSGKFEYFARYC